MDIYNPARVKHAFFPRCSLCGRLWLRARPSLRTQYVAMHVISPFSGIVNSQRKQASCRNNFAIILQGLLHTPFASMFLQLSLCDHPASSDLHSHVVECQCVYTYILLWSHVYMSYDIRIKRFLATRLNFNYYGRHNTSAPCCAHGAHATRISVVILVRCRPRVCGSGAS